jgi:hypothetical protein
MIMLVSSQPTCNSFAGISSIRNTKQFSEKNGYISQGENDVYDLVAIVPGMFEHIMVSLTNRSPYCRLPTMLVDIP